MGTKQYTVGLGNWAFHNDVFSVLETGADSEARI